MSHLFRGKEQSVAQMMVAREGRVERQEAFIQMYHQPVVAYKLNIPGAVKDSEGIREIFFEGLSSFKKALIENQMSLIEELVELNDSGPEAFLVVGAPTEILKALAISLEDGHPLGRLMDLDVIDTSGESLSRSFIKLEPRRCLICDLPAVVCARSRAHGLDALKENIEVLYTSYFKK